MKKILIFAMCLVMAFTFVSCADITSADDGKLDIVCTSFAPYDWIKNIIKNSENVNLTLLNGKGTDIHSYEPSAEDIINISGCDILIAVGGAGDKWALDAASVSDETVAVSLLGLAGFHEDYGELLSHDHDSECDHSHVDSAETADEHIWMSIKNAVFFAEEIAEIICSKDEENSELYKSNLENYVNLLNQLDNEYEKAVSSSPKPVMVVADRFPFLYLTNDYGIECFAAFPGCSADTDASPETVIRLSEAVDEHNLSFVAVTENTTGKTAKAVIENTKEKNQETVVINSMQAVSEKDMEKGATYIGIMEQNLDAIKMLLEIK